MGRNFQIDTLQSTNYLIIGMEITNCMQGRSPFYDKYLNTRPDRTMKSIRLSNYRNVQSLEVPNSMRVRPDQTVIGRANHVHRQTEQFTAPLTPHLSFCVTKMFRNRQIYCLTR